MSQSNCEFKKYYAPENVFVIDRISRNFPPRKFHVLSITRDWSQEHKKGCVSPFKVCIY